MIAGEHQLWWSPRDQKQKPFWRSRVVLGRAFFAEITGSAVPVDLRALRLLKRSPLALDIYVWLTYRMSYLKKPTLVPWKSVEAQFGADYSRLRDFRSHAVTQLEKVIRVYPTVRVSHTSTGLRLYSSPPHIQRVKGPAHSSALDGEALNSAHQSGGNSRSKVECRK